MYRVMYRVLAICFTLISGSAAAQDCFLFFCPPRPLEPRYQPEPPPIEPRRGDPSFDAGFDRRYAAMYGPIAGEKFRVPAVPLSDVHPNYLRRIVAYSAPEAAGTIVIDPQSHYLYLVQGNGRALRYGIGVGREGFGWSGVAIIRDKREWPDWYPPKEMIQRQPELRRHLTQLQSGVGVAGGLGNPLGARAMYLWRGNKDTLYRIHGTNEPETIGRSVSSGCIRMLNQDVIDLYQRTPVGTKVVVLRSRAG